MRRGGSCRALRGLLLPIGLAVLLAPPPASGEGGRERVPLQWSLVQAGPHERSLEISFAHGGCQRSPRVAVAETSSTVSVTATVEDEKTTGPCPLFEVLGFKDLSLAHPLAGRALTGTWQASPTVPFGTKGVRRVIGLAPADARKLLAAGGSSGIHVVTRYTRGRVPRARVVSQDPGAGGRLPRDRVVHLVVSSPGG